MVARRSWSYMLGIAGPPWRSKSQVTSLGWRVRSFAPRRILRPMRFARMAEQGLTGITIVNPEGESYDIDRFGMVVSTRWSACRPDFRPEAPRDVV